MIAGLRPPSEALSGDEERGESEAMSMHEWIQKGAISDDLAKERGLQELVRCKDCWKRGSYYDCDCHENGKDENDDWFCADGERKMTGKLNSC